MLIYRKTSRAVDWKSVLWFALGVFVTLCVATYMHFDTAGGCAKSSAATAALEPRPVTQPAQPARPPESTTQMSAGSNPAPAAAARPLAKETTPRIVANGVEADVSLSATSEVGRKEMAPVAPAPEAPAQVLPPEAASVLATGPSQADIELENHLRSQSESAAARIPSAIDTSLLPHEKL